jgi:phosphate transport system permease protein
MFVVVLAVMLLALFFARLRLAPRFRARNGVETALSIFMIACSVVAILTTIGIVVSLLYEAWQFFKLVPPAEFFFGLRWEPQIAIRARPDRRGRCLRRGAGLPRHAGHRHDRHADRHADRHLHRDLSRRIRLGPRTQIVKPLMEILAGVPTVVYGFFAC